MHWLGLYKEVRSWVMKADEGGWDLNNNYVSGLLLFLFIVLVVGGVLWCSREPDDGQERPRQRGVHVYRLVTEV